MRPTFSSTAEIVRKYLRCISVLRVDVWTAVAWFTLVRKGYGGRASAFAAGRATALVSFSCQRAGGSNGPWGDLKPSTARKGSWRWRFMNSIVKAVETSSTQPMVLVFAPL